MKKIKYSCGIPTNASCVSTEVTPNSQSPLLDEECLSQEEVNQDIYTQLEEIDLSELGEKCLSYVETEEGKIVVKNVLLKFEQEICDLKQKVEELETTDICNKDITGCSIDFDCLEIPCGETITTLKDWMAAVTNKICV